MKVKRYVVDSMPEALQKIRNDLGKDAVILNTKEIRSGGFIGLFGKRKIEVIAAIETSAAAVGMERQFSAPNTPTPPQKERIHPPRTDVANDSHLLLNEIKQMKEMVRNLSVVGSEQKQSIALKNLEERLLDQELDPMLIHQLITNVNDREGEKDLEHFSEMTSVKSDLLNILKSEYDKTISMQTRIAHFVGPTGVGKTTTIAKLAAEQVLKHHRKVGFITSDTYRIAAVEQLKTYATILNVPLEVVFSPQDLTKAFQNLKDCDLIFMDTAGRNFRNEMYVSELNALLQANGESETFLVLSLTMKYNDMKAIVENFMKFKLDKVLFTKIDETATYGSIVNLAHHFPLKLSYMTNGQSVPEDILVADENEIVSLILGELAHE